MKLFDWVSEVKTKKRKWDSFSESEQKTFSPYMIHRFLSMNQNYIEIVNDFQKYWSLEPKQVYEFYWDVLPNKRSFDRYIKNTKKDRFGSSGIIKDTEWVIDILCKYFQESKNHINEYLYLIADSELKTILEMYGTDPKQIKKLKLEK